MSPLGGHPGRVLRRRGLVPHKGWGQNFLSDGGVAERIAGALDLWPTPTVLEIGPGLGALTEVLLAAGGRVVAIERDPALVELLAEQLGDHRSFELVHGDATRCDWLALLEPWPQPHVLVGNLPYGITGKLIARTVAVARCLAGAVLMVQREVGDRLRAPPGSRTYGAPSVFTQAAFEVEELFRVGPGAFYPKPQVASVVLRLVPRSRPRAIETEAFRRVVKSAFAARRKMLRNAWRQLGGWSSTELQRHAAAAGVALDSRAEALDVEDFGAMAERLERFGRTPDGVG